MMGKTAGPLAPIKTVEPNSPSNHCILHYAVMVFFWKKKNKKPTLRMSLMKKKKTFIFKNLNIWTNIFLILLWLNEKEAYTTYAAIKVKWLSRWKSTHVITVQAKSSLLGGTLFLFEEKKKDLIGKLLIIQIQVHGKYFLKNKPSEPISSRKIQILSDTHDKIQAFKWKF